MIRRGHTANLVADILGHNDPGFTLKVYAHVWEEESRERAPSVADLYGPPVHTQPAAFNWASCGTVVTISRNLGKSEIEQKQKPRPGRGLYHLAREVGVEPTTIRLTVERSATELLPTTAAHAAKRSLAAGQSECKTRHMAW